MKMWYFFFLLWIIKRDGEIGQHFDLMEDGLLREVVEFPVEFRNIDGLSDEKNTFLDFIEMGCSLWEEIIS